MLHDQSRVAQTLGFQDRPSFSADRPALADSLLRDVFPLQRYNNLPGFADATPDLIEAILSKAAKLCEETLLPLLNQPGDRAPAAFAARMAPLPLREDLRRPTARSSRAAGSVLPPIPNLAARGCLVRSPRSNSRVPRIWLSQCIWA
jgi:hypothetical protein